MKVVFHRLCFTVVTAVLLWATGCSVILVQSQREPDALTYAPTNWRTVQVLNAQPAAPHVRLGKITLQPSASHAEQEVQATLQREAAKMGANAVVITSDRTQWVKGPSEISFPGQRHEGGEARVVVAEAIRFTN